MKIKFAINLVALPLLALLAFNSQFATAFAQGTAFTYQGQLQNNGSPASGTYNLSFSLFTVSSGGSAIAGPATNSGVLVTNGLFTVLIDFGPGVFTGTSNWLEIAVETNLDSSFTTLAPRQQLTPVPYAIFAASASNLLGSLPAAQLSGTVLLSQLPGAVVTNNEPSVTLGNVTVGGGLNLPATATIPSGSSTLLHADGVSGNFFAGQNAGNLTTRGLQNTALGETALYNITTGSGNIATGDSALYDNSTGSENLAIGVDALAYNTTGSGNVAIGNQALQNDNAYNNGFTTGGNGHNTAVGYQALQADTTGAGNTALGYIALQQNINGNYNTAIGDFTIISNTTGSYNVAVGAEALEYNTTGSNNTATGYGALSYTVNDSSGNTADGCAALFSVT